MYTRKLLPGLTLPTAALGVLVAFAIGIVPACTSSAKPPQENTEVNQMDTSQDTKHPTPEPLTGNLPPIDATAPKEVQTATFATG